MWLASQVAVQDSVYYTGLKDGSAALPSMGGSGVLYGTVALPPVNWFVSLGYGRDYLIKALVSDCELLGFVPLCGIVNLSIIFIESMDV